MAGEMVSASLPRGTDTVWRRWYAVVWPPLLAAIIFLGAWEFAVWWFKLPNFVLPAPGEIVATAVQDPHRVLVDTGTTVAEALVGYVAGSLVGLALAILFVTFARIERFLLPIYVTINSVPMVAYGPLAIILLGIGSSSKILLITVAVSYQVLINALAGLRSCDPGSIALLRTFGANNRTILLKLRLPGAMPAIMFGLRVAVVHAMILAVVLEMLGARAGLGWSVYKSTQMMYFVEAWVAVGASVIVSLAIYAVVNWIGRKLVWW
ncbi:ABC transporter permease [Bradyrhizobium sp. NP1]|uniref:ABC transporter permease n=1 Tax=Bradyrhizobium sp. NP1 TaxID=3049772 RepID=UPI0025A57C87|nr:ABC transporter permease [Bradyrhizobium sp. NP1]WJR76653.1 ABC transporter permease [Bradyrhizobium sp. NP1]